MDTNQRFQENLQLFRDAVQMKKTKRIPFFSTDAFWRFQDAGFTLSECLTDHEKLNEAKRWNWSTPRSVVLCTI